MSCPGAERLNGSRLAASTLSADGIGPFAQADRRDMKPDFARRGSRESLHGGLALPMSGRKCLEDPV